MTTSAESEDLRKSNEYVRSIYREILRMEGAPQEQIEALTVPRFGWGDLCVELERITGRVEQLTPNEDIVMIDVNSMIDHFRRCIDKYDVVEEQLVEEPIAQ